MKRCMIVDGVRYGHVLDPRTGWPVEENSIGASAAAPLAVSTGAPSSRRVTTSTGWV